MCKVTLINQRGEGTSYSEKESDGSITKRFQMSEEAEMPLLGAQLHHRHQAFCCRGNGARHRLHCCLFILLTL
ncbi:hypothetical protein XENTR_v10013541 [Xenopus tropicalis]|nr:hypothetical protein XENTR_v10013541 [Xenopus tropicalis]